jgi:hypothetical protein
MEYFFKRCADHTEIFKDDFADGPLYVIKDKSCSCPGCVYHKVKCKHLKIHELIRWGNATIFRYDGLTLTPWNYEQA